MGLPIKEIKRYIDKYKMKKRFGIVGNPIKHSLSPILHGYWFDKYGLDASYSIIEAEDKDLKKVVNSIRKMSWME